MRRRDFVLGALGAGLASTGAFDSLVRNDITAQAAFARGGIPYGAAVRTDLLDTEFDYKEAIIDHCQIVVGEGGLKWIDLRPSQEQFVFEQPDRLIDFANRNGMQMRGHTLAWYGAMPDWTKTIASAAEAERELVHHITTVVGRYRGRIPSWDVVNEAIAETPMRGSVIRNSIWQERLGPRYIEIALRTAAAVDPSAQLVINDYNVENPTPQCRDRRKALLDLLRSLKDRDVPFHAVGIQGHLPGDLEIDREGLSRFVEDVKGMQLDVLVTELDVIDDKLPPNEYDRDRIVARRAGDFLAAIDEAARPSAVLTWGITDRYTWVPMWFKRSDGKPNRPLPLDASCRPKALMKVIDEFTRAAE
ncbi:MULTISPECIES: endo-1,4-beta-xylanase [unclassified Rhizobium]|uniref:endo-1,4-beta-xylanase n=1 Tax=unclassified Rhizobium TaxID=2613769 RepID=UPI00161BF943|nr:MULTISPECIES: endo-1,4-beta-xylanase [unclassified Rhizobium]MBB3320259.1 endo-1,4-beta-xylanase [Rhizobium sp. BK181]MCS4096015.1 endo-1,4-beta-xylanase [Rhizobium sp. BK176]